MGITRGAKRELLTLVDHDPAQGPAAERGWVDETAGDFDAFYCREYSGLVVLARALVGPAMADDVAQEAMLAAFRRWDDVQLMLSPAAWVRGACLHKAGSLVRRRSVEQRVLRGAGERARNRVGAGMDVEARLGELKATSRRRGGARAVAALMCAAAVVVAVAGLVPLGSGEGPAVVDPNAGDPTVSCHQALADTLSPDGAVRCVGARVVLVRGPVDYTFRLPRGVPWKVGASGSPWAVEAMMDPWTDSASVSVLAGVRAADGSASGRELRAGQLASWIASRRFLVATPMSRGMQDGLPTWTVEVRPRTGVARSGPGRACNGVGTDCHALLRWQQGSSFNEVGAQDGEVLRVSFVDVPARGVVALVARADLGTVDSLAGASELLRSVDFMFAID